MVPGDSRGNIVNSRISFLFILNLFQYVSGLVFLAAITIMSIDALQDPIRNWMLDLGIVNFGIVPWISGVVWGFTSLSVICMQMKYSVFYVKSLSIGNFSRLLGVLVLLVALNSSFSNSSMDMIWTNVPWNIPCAC